MSFWYLVRKEIAFRKMGFAIGLVSMVAAVGILVGAVTLLKAHDVRTEQVLVERERQTRQEMERLERDYRRIMREMGYNVMVLHADQSIAQLRSDGYAEKLMPEDYPQRLVDGYIETLNHLLPVLQRRVKWPEYDLDVILSGTPGQTPMPHKAEFLTASGDAYRNPVMEAVPAGALKLGHGVARELDVRRGDTVTLMGESFRVHRVAASQGNTDDLMVWCDLQTAQRLLELPGKINAIFALECVCDTDALGAITAEVREVLPDAQVLEFSSRIIARAEARQRAEEAGRVAIDAEIEHRRQMGAERRALAGILVPVVLAGSGIWVFFLVLSNVREREAEIGILRAIGVRENKIVGVFLSKAMIMGAIGALAGYLLGVVVGAVWGGVIIGSAEFVQLLSPPLLLAAVIIAVAVCALAGWLPAMKAAQQDPAVVLRAE